MTKLTPLEELSEKLEIYSESHYDSINDTDYTEYTLTTFQLEQLRQAIIRDFVSTLEPRAYVVRLTNSVTDVLNWEIPDKNWRELGCKAQHYAPLYELPIISEWKAK